MIKVLKKNKKTDEKTIVDCNRRLDGHHECECPDERTGSTGG